jgi:hypothetical protein
MVHPLGCSVDCGGKDDGPTEWERIVELPKQLQREFPDYYQRFSKVNFVR